MHKKKPRSNQIRLDFGKAQTLTGAELLEDGSLIFYDENGQAVVPSSVEVGAVHPREHKAPKALWRAKATSHRIQTDQNRLLADYDVVMAVDTNTETIDGVQVSMTACVLVRNFVLGPSLWAAQLIPQDAFEFHDSTEAPEIIGWCDAIQRLQDTQALRGRMAIIVDSELGLLPEFNARSRPLMSTFYVPENMTLVYASAERATTDFVGNAAIAECNKTATLLLRRVKTRDGYVTAMPVENRAYRRCQYWIGPK